MAQQRASSGCLCLLVLDDNHCLGWLLHCGSARILTLTCRPCVRAFACTLGPWFAFSSGTSALQKPHIVRGAERNIARAIGKLLGIAAVLKPLLQYHDCPELTGSGYPSVCLRIRSCYLQPNTYVNAAFAACQWPIAPLAHHSVKAERASAACHAFMTAYHCVSGCAALFAPHTLQGSVKW